MFRDKPRFLGMSSFKIPRTSNGAKISTFFASSWPRTTTISLLGHGEKGAPKKLLLAIYIVFFALLQYGVDKSGQSW